MLKHSSKLLLRSYRAVNHRSLTSNVKKLREPSELKSDVPRSLQDKVQLAANTALLKYNELIGFNEIDDAYKKVTLLQESLHSIQTERSMIQLQIANIRSDLTNLQTEISELKRGEPKYLELMRREFEVIQKKNQLEEHYDILDNKEREQFSHLQARINMLHEKSRTHTRQWGIISTIIGALLGVIGTSVSAYYRNNDIRKIQMSIQTLIQEQIEQTKKDSEQIMECYNNLMVNLQRYETILKANAANPEKPKNSESWGGYLKRKSNSVWRWCTFQKAQQIKQHHESEIAMSRQNG